MGGAEAVDEGFERLGWYVEDIDPQDRILLVVGRERSFVGHAGDQET